MEKIDRIIEIIRESMVANAPGQSGAFSSSSPAEGPTAGSDVPIDFRRKRFKNFPIFYRDMVKKITKRKKK